MTALTLAESGRNRRKARRRPLQLLPPPSGDVRPVPRLEIIERKGPVLRPNPLSEGSEEVLGLNVTTGCPHRCPFCFARAYPGYPGDDTVYLHAHLAEQVRAELRQRRKPPRAIYLCPSTDPFPPFAEVQAETCRVIETLAKEGVEAWIMTRGFIRPAAVEVLARHRKLVRVTVALTTLDRTMSRRLEPLAAPPRLRLKLVRQLVERGIQTQAAVDPLVPGLTDTHDNLAPLVDALAEAGVEHLTAGYLFLRHGIRDNLLKELGDLGDLADSEAATSILERYANGPVLPMGNTAPARHLPRAERQRGYALLTALAAGRGLSVNVSRVTNPDFRPPRPEPESRPMRQMMFPYN
jgi:DNA repair photolyase